MKCPKCGFNSFEFLDNCKKCGVSLASFKKSMGVSPVVFASGQSVVEVPQPPPMSVPVEEASMTAAPVVPRDEVSEETFTWDIPAPSETAPETDTAFSGFDLDFMKDDEKPVEPETVLSTDEEKVTESAAIPQTESADSFEEFSFYENTLDPVDVSASAPDADDPSGGSPFGDTGVMGEILPEQLEAAGREQEIPESAGNFPHEAERYENEFSFEHLSGGEENAEVKDKETKKNPLDISDFERDFESIFQTDEEPEKDKAAH